MEPKKRFALAAAGLAVGGFGPTFTQMASGWQFHFWWIAGPALAGIALALPAALDANKANDMAAGAIGWIGALSSAGWLLAAVLGVVLF